MKRTPSNIVGNNHIGNQLIKKTYYLKQSLLVHFTAENTEMNPFVCPVTLAQPEFECSAAQLEIHVSYPHDWVPGPCMAPIPLHRVLRRL